MDGLHQLDIASLAPSSLAQRLVATVLDGSSGLLVGQDETVDCLRVAGLVLGAARTRVLHVHQPLDLTDFLEQVALPAPEECALEQGFERLTELDASCDRIVLLVEDAHLLPHPTLRYIEMTLKAGPHLQVVLAGQPRLIDMLALPGFAWLQQRLSVRIDIAEPLVEPAQALFMPVAKARRSWQPAVLVGAIAASAALVAWSFQPSPLPAPLPVAVADAVVDPTPAPLPVVAEASVMPAPVLVEDVTPAPELAAPVVAQEPEREAPVLAEAPLAEDSVPEAAPSPAMAADAPSSIVASIPDTSPDPVPPVVVEAPAPVLQAQPPVQPQAKRVVAVPIPPRQAPVRPTPVRPERVISLTPAPAPNERRCRDIVLRAQLGEAPVSGDQIFLRNGCR